MEILSSLSGCKLVALASLIAVTLAEELSIEETDILGNFLSAVGSNLSTIAVANAEKTLQ